MEFSHSDNLPNSQYNELITNAKNIAERLKFVDKSTADLMVEKLNVQAVEHGLIDKEIELHTHFAVRSSKTIDFNTGRVQTLYLPDDTPEPVVTGTLLGFKVIPHEVSNVLMYHLQTEFVPERRTFYVVDVPVEDASFIIDETETEAAVDDYHREEIDYYVQVLSQIRDTTFRKNLNRFLSRIEAYKEADADFFADIGLVAGEMLAHEKVMQDDEYKQAISGIIGNLVIGGAMYSIQGHCMNRPNVEGESTFDIKVVDVESVVAEIELVDNYTINSQQKLVLPPKGQLQPAFVVYGDTGIPHYLPLRQINNLRIIKSDDVYDRSCRAAFARHKTA